MSSFIGVIVGLFTGLLSIFGLGHTAPASPQLPPDIGINSAQQTVHQATNIPIPSRPSEQVSVQVSTGAQTISVPGMSKYTDSDFGFSFWYPSGWQVTKRHSGSGSFSPMSVDIASHTPDGGYRTEISILELDHNPVLDTQKAYPPGHTMGGIAVASYPANVLGTQFVISLSARGVLLISRGSTGSSIDPSLMVATIVPTEMSIATPASAAEQIKTIQAEQQAYAGQ